MFCKKSRDEAARRSREIQRELDYDAQKDQEYIKLLLLGTGESGKTTIIKQMKIIHINGFSETERKSKIPFIKQNIHESIYVIVNAMDKITPPVSLQNQENIASAQYILKIGSGEPEEFTKEYFDHVQILWNDLGVKETYERSNEYQLIDSAEHFLDRIEEVQKSDYIPTTKDILFCRITTTTISKIEFKVSVPKKYGGGEAKFVMYDVGGQRGHRKRWISVFEGVSSILFLIAASDFDQQLREDQTQNRLIESLKLFREMFWSRFLRTAGTIVFLNKQDILKRKIENGKRLDPQIFPDYINYKITEKDEDPNDEYARSKIYMKKKLLEIVRNKPRAELVGLIPGHNLLQEIEDRTAYIHFTVATDTNNIKLVFKSVHEIILNENLKTSGILY